MLDQQKAVEAAAAEAVEAAAAAIRHEISEYTNEVNIKF